MCPLQLCSAGNYPCVHYSYGVPSIICVSITVSLCVHNNEVVPAISGAGKTQNVMKRKKKQGRGRRGIEKHMNRGLEMKLKNKVRKESSSGFRAAVLR